MTEIRIRDSIRRSYGRVHLWIPDPAQTLGGRIETTVVRLERLDSEGPGKDRLWGQYVRVRNAAVLNRPGSKHDEVVAIPVGDAQPDRNGDFLFEPRRGGARMDNFRLRSERYRQRYIEASRFGEVNT